MDYKQVNGDFIKAYCKENKQVTWLKEACKPNDEGKRPSFLAVKRAFCEKFMPEIIPQAKPKKIGFFESVDSL